MGFYNLSSTTVARIMPKALATEGETFKFLEEVVHLIAVVEKVRVSFLSEDPRAIDRLKSGPFPNRCNKPYSGSQKFSVHPMKLRLQATCANTSIGI